MNKPLRIGLLVAALAFSAGVIYGGMTRDLERAALFLGLALTVLIFERITEVWS